MYSNDRNYMYVLPGPMSNFHKGPGVRLPNCLIKET